jgi:hypothetical protein
LRRDNDRFLPKSSCGLSYQACSIPRIMHPPGMPVCGDWQFVIVFLILRRRCDG